MLIKEVEEECTKKKGKKRKKDKKDNADMLTKKEDAKEDVTLHSK